MTMNYSKYKVDIWGLETKRLKMWFSLSEFSKYLKVSKTNYYRMRKYQWLCSYKVYTKIKDKLPRAFNPLLNFKGYKQWAIQLKRSELWAKK